MFSWGIKRDQLHGIDLEQGGKNLQESKGQVFKIFNIFLILRFLIHPKDM